MVAVGNERGAHKAGTNVVQTNVMQVPDGAQLLQAFHIVTHIALGGRVGWCRPKSLGARNAADHGDVCGLITLGKVSEDRIDHASESQCVSLHGAQFLIGIEGRILVTDARTVKVKLDASHLSNQLQQLGGSVGIGNVDARPSHHPIRLRLDAFQFLFTAACYAHLPSLAAQLAHHLEPDARSRTHHHRTAAIFIFFHINRSFLTQR